MKVIADQFVKKGFVHKVIARDGMKLLIERKHHTAASPHWEVVKLRVSPEKRVGERTYMEGEAYPSSEAWGSQGWTYTDLESAKAKFDLL
jgi:hypothetical protein